MTTIRFISGEAALRNFIGGIHEQVDERIDASGYSASGALKKSLRTETHAGPGATTAELFALSYWKWVGNGRAPGKPPPLDPIIQWVKDKGLATTDQSIYRLGIAIRAKIGKEGTLDHQLGGKNIFAEAVREAQPKIPDVLGAFLTDVSRPIVSQFTGAFKVA